MGFAIFEFYNAHDLYKALLFAVIFLFTAYHVPHLALKVHMAWRRTVRTINGVSLTNDLSNGLLNPTLKPSDEDLNARRLRRTFKFTSLIFLLVVLLGIVWVTQEPARAAVSTTGIIFVAAPLYIMSVVVLRIMLGYYIIYVQQKPGSAEFVVAGRKRPGSSWGKKTAATLLCACLPYAGVLLQDDMSWFIMGSCAVMTMCASMPTFPALRPIIPRLELGFMVVVATVLPVAIYGMLRGIYTTGGETTPGSDGKLDADFFTFSLNWLSRWMMVTLEAIPMVLLSLCLRLDMHLHLSSLPTASMGVDHQISFISATDAGLRPKSPASLQESHSLDNSTVVPESLPPFKKPYFHAGFAACVVATATAALFAPLIPHTHDTIDAPLWNIVYTMTVMDAALTSILCSILLTAWYRSELKEVWGRKFL